MKKQKFADKVKYALKNHKGLQAIVQEYKAWRITCTRNPDKYRMKICNGIFVIEKYNACDGWCHCTIIFRGGATTIKDWF